MKNDDFYVPEMDIENGEFKLNEMYSEIFKLEQMLLTANIPYQMRRNFDGWQIGYPELPPENGCKCSVIQHFGSYGGTEDLIEIMGLTENGDEAEGWLTAEDVFNRIYRHYKGCVSQE